MTFQEVVLELLEGRCKGIRRKSWAETAIWELPKGTRFASDTMPLCQMDAFVADDWELIPKKKSREEVIMFLEGNNTVVTFKNKFGSPPINAKLFAEWEA
jgi:hypothetical protein